MSRVQLYLDAIAHLHVSGVSSLVSVILFGSASSGAFSESSDVDLIIVLPDATTAQDRRRLRETVSALEITHGLRSHASLPKSPLEKFAEHAGGDAHSCFICTRSDLLSGSVARVLSLRPVEALLVDRIVLAGIIASAKTVWGEELLPVVSLPPIRRLDVFKALLGLGGLALLSVAAFPVLPDATRYSMGALKHSLHSCYFCYHRKSAPLNEEVELFNLRLGRNRTLLELLDQRQSYRRSFAFALRCVPAIFRLHLRTAWDNQSPAQWREHLCQAKNPCAARGGHQLASSGTLTVRPMHCSFPKRRASNSALFRRNSEGTLDIVSTSCSRSLPETSKKLEGSRNHYRLRVGGYRILFRMDTNTLEVYAVKQRKDAYE